MDTEERIATKYVSQTYKVTFAMLIVGQAQVIVSMQFSQLRSFLQEYYFISLIQFFVSFLSLQLYVFFFNVIETKAAWIRAVLALWTYEANTLCIMTPSHEMHFFMLAISFVYVYIVMILSVMYGKRQGGRYLSRGLLILWSERIFVVISFGIIVSAEMHRDIFEFFMLFIYTITSNVFIFLFATSIRKPGFYRTNNADWLLIGQLYYLSFYVLFNGFIWTIAALKNIFFGK